MGQIVKKIGQVDPISPGKRQFVREIYSNRKISIEKTTAVRRNLFKRENLPQKTFCLSEVFKMNNCHLSTFASIVSQNQKRNKNEKLQSYRSVECKSIRTTTCIIVHIQNQMSMMSNL